MFKIFGFDNTKQEARTPIVFKLPADLEQVGIDINASEKEPDTDMEVGHRIKLAEEALELFGKSIGECEDLDGLKAIRLAVREFYFGLEDEFTEDNILDLLDDRAVAIAEERLISGDVEGASEMVDFPFADQTKGSELQGLINLN